MLAHENPFASDRIESIPYLSSEGSLIDIKVKLELMGFRAAVIGPPGSGKTTLLESIQRALDREGYDTAYLALREEDRYPALRALSFLLARGREDIVFLDGAEQLSGPIWRLCRWLSHRYYGFVASAHKPVGMPVLLQSKTSPELLAEILRSFSGSTIPANDERFVQTLFQRHRGNIRDALRECYDLEAGLS